MDLNTPAFIVAEMKMMEFIQLQRRHLFQCPQDSRFTVKITRNIDKQTTILETRRISGFLRVAIFIGPLQEPSERIDWRP